MIRALFLFAALVAPNLVSAAPAVTAEEDAALRAGEVVIRELPRKGDVVRLIAYVDVHADRAAVWAALLDFPSRKVSNPAVKRVDAYLPATATDRWIRWTVEKLGMQLVYHNHYRLDLAAGRLTHDLDPAQANDLVASRGVYELAASPAGPEWTRLSWEVESNFGRAVPTVVQGWLTAGATRDFMADMARRAEAAR